MGAAFIAFSYHYNSDIDFVRNLTKILHEKQIPTWHLETLNQQKKVWQNTDYSWQQQPQNWQATFLQHLIHARGVIVVLSPNAKESLETGGRGMWREKPAIKFIQEDNPQRVLKVEVFPINDKTQNRIFEIVEWCRKVLLFPEVNRKAMDEQTATSFNIPTGNHPCLQLPETKYVPSYWCEIVRLDLYDAEWHCRKCGLKSENYMVAAWNPPQSCPRCGYGGETTTEQEKKNQEDEEAFKAKPETQAFIEKVQEKTTLKKYI